MGYSNILCVKYKKNGKNKFPTMSIVFLCLIISMSYIVPIFINESQNYIDLSRTYIPPCRKYIFGTDSMGRNIFIRCLYGGRVSLMVGIVCMTVSSIIGIAYGCVSGYFGKTLDKIMMRVLELFLVMPTIILIVFIQAFFKDRGLWEIIIFISLTAWMRIARIVRGEVLRIKCMDFVQASKNLGGGFIHIVKKHFIPNFVPTIIYICTLNAAYAIITESTLSFLGLGLPAEVVSWGSMLIDAQKDILSNKWWTGIWPGVLIVITVYSVTNIGEHIRKVNNKQFASI